MSENIEINEREVKDTPSYRFAASVIASHPNRKQLRITQHGDTSYIHHKDGDDSRSIEINHKDGKIHWSHEDGAIGGSGGDAYVHTPEKAKSAIKKILGENFNEESMEEETAAAATIKPKGRADAINVVTQLMSGMSIEDLNGFVQSMMQYAQGKDWGVPEGAAQHNASTIMTKPSHATGAAVKEDLENIFDGQDLSEEFKEKTATLFEAAVNIRVTTEVARLEEEYEAALNEQIEAFNEQVTTKIDAYLDYVVENWMQENEVAIESTLRNELMEEFMEGLKNLFAEHYISIPEEKVDVVEALTEKVSSLEEKLDEAITYNNELRGVLVIESAKQIFATLASDLALTQQEKFATLAEGIEFDGDLEVFAKKLAIIKENYFGTETKTAYSSNINEETFEGEVSPEFVSNDPINRYAQAIAKTVKK